MEHIVRPITSFHCEGHSFCSLYHVEKINFVMFKAQILFKAGICLQVQNLVVNLISIFSKENIVLILMQYNSQCQDAMKNCLMSSWCYAINSLWINYRFHKVENCQFPLLLYACNAPFNFVKCFAFQNCEKLHDS